MNREDCKGCSTDDPDASCPWFMENLEDICPCVNCLVKMMCKIDCPDFLSHTSHTPLAKRIKGIVL